MGAIGSSISGTLISDVASGRGANDSPPDALEAQAKVDLRAGSLPAKFDVVRHDNSGAVIGSRAIAEGRGDVEEVLLEREAVRLVSKVQADEALQNISRLVSEGQRVGNESGALKFGAGMPFTSPAALWAKLGIMQFNEKVTQIQFKIEAQKSDSMLQKEAITERLKAQLEEMSLNTQKTVKVGKGLFAKVLFDWVGAGVNLFQGLFKVAAAVGATVATGGGAAAGGGLLLASGLADLAAGAAGLTKAALRTAALCSSDEDAEKLNAVADGFEIAEQVLMGVSMALVVVNVARMATAAGRIAVAGASAIESGAAKTVATSVATRAASGEQVFAQMGREVGKEAWEGAVTALTQSLRKVLPEKAAGFVTKSVMGSIGKSSAQQLFGSILEQAAKSTTKEMGKKALLTAEGAASPEFVKLFSKAVAEIGEKELKKNGVQFIQKVFAGASGAVKLASATHTHVVNLAVNEIDEKIGNQVMQQMVIAMAMDNLTRQQKRRADALKTDLDDLGQGLNDAHRGIREATAATMKLVTISHV